MSTFEDIALRQAPSYGLRDPLTVGIARRANDALGYLRSEPWIARLAVCCGFTGAVLMQAGLFSLFARLALMLDSLMLPSQAASACCVAVGTVVMLTSRSLIAPQPSPSRR